jgi:ABC-type uncharacterized transport system substrate-binding protein
MSGMGRRELMALMGGAAAWPVAARGQQPTMPIIGFVTARSAEASVAEAAAFRKGLSETGYVEGENVAVEYHWLDGQFSRLPSVMADLVRRRVAVIATPNNATALAAKAATTTIPIVFAVGEDPVKLGLVVSLARPGGNATGINFFNGEIVAKRLGLLHDLLPKAARVAVLVNPANTTTEVMLERCPKLHAVSDCKFRSLTSAPSARSMRRSPPWRASKPTRSSLPPTRSSSAGPFNLRHSRRAMRFPRPMAVAILWQSVD